MDSKWIRMSMDEVTTPKSGRICYTDRWWVVTRNNEVLFYKSYTSPQCNHNKAVVDHALRNIQIVECTVQFIPVAFIPHRCSDYV